MTTVSGLSKPQTCDRYASVRRLANTLLRTWLSTGFIIAVIMWQHSGLYLPNGDPAHDRTVKPRADMMIFYGAAKVMRHSPADLYDQRKEAAAQKAATGLEISSEDRDFLPYAYPAIVALLFVPFTVLSYKTAYFLMLIINFLLLGITLWILSDRLKLCGHNEKIFVLSATAFLPVYAVFLNGQLSFLLLLFSSLTITNLRAGRMVRAGILPKDENSIRLFEIVQLHTAFADADAFVKRRTTRFVTHVRAVGQIVGAELPCEQLVEKRCFVARPSAGIKGRRVGSR